MVSAEPRRHNALASKLVADHVTGAVGIPPRTAESCPDRMARSSRRAQVASLATGAGLAGAAALVALNDPSAPGSRFPACGFHATTGLWCPGCGLTRATHHLLTGDVAAALSSNVFTPFVLAAIVATWATWTLGTFGRVVRNPILRLPAWSGPALVVLLVVFGVARNLPGDPWQALAP
jgi:Protein of unknown function (DUF2752)